ncbi:MAG: histidine kinase [Actinoplanes sp.]
MGRRAGRSPSEYRWLLPAGLLDEPDRPPARRSTRDWAIDALCFAIGLGWALWSGLDLLGPDSTVVPQFSQTPDWLVWTDMITGVLFAGTLWWRRRWPVHLAVLAMVTGVFSVTVAFAALIIAFTVAVHRRFAVTAIVSVGGLLSSVAFGVIRPEDELNYWESMAWSVLITVIVLLWGMVVRSRRELVVSLRDRAERAESEQHLRIAQARALERTRIAREMHDVLAHRISLLSLHAGALEFHPDASPDEVAGAAGVIRASAHQALQDLREVIGVLREPAAGDTTPEGTQPTPERPQPTLGELPALADESRAAGVKVRLQVEVDESQQLPAATGRTAYRIVQEGLTNARKHAPGTTVQVAVAGAAGQGLSITVSNPGPVGGLRASAIPGTGTGLIGLTERAALAGGELTHGRTRAGDFSLTAWLPWPP